MGNNGDCTTGTYIYRSPGTVLAYPGIWATRFAGWEEWGREGGWEEVYDIGLCKYGTSLIGMGRVW